MGRVALEAVGVGRASDQLSALQLGHGVHDRGSGAVKGEMRGERGESEAITRRPSGPLSTHRGHARTIASASTRP